MINVDLDERQPSLDGMLLGKRREDGCDSTAGWAPVGVEVDNDVSCRAEDLYELGGLCYFLDLGRGLGDGRLVGKDCLDGVNTELPLEVTQTYLLGNDDDDYHDEDPDAPLHGDGF